MEFFILLNFLLWKMFLILKKRRKEIKKGKERISIENGNIYVP